MARKKKTEPQYYHVWLCDTLVKIAIKYNFPLEYLQKLNPDIRSSSARLKTGRKVRIS